jgi:hypothetical protein
MGVLCIFEIAPQARANVAKSPPSAGDRPGYKHRHPEVLAASAASLEGWVVRDPRLRAAETMWLKDRLRVNIRSSCGNGGFAVLKCHLQLLEASEKHMSQDEIDDYYLVRLVFDLRKEDPLGTVMRGQMHIEQELRRFIQSTAASASHANPDESDFQKQFSLR